MDDDIWFKSKRYGYGWYPTTLQGGLVLMGFVAALVPTIIILNRIYGMASVGFAFWIMLALLAYSIVLLQIVRQTSDSPR